MPCWELFEAAREYRAPAVLGTAPIRVAGRSRGRPRLGPLLGGDGAFIGMHGFGASAPGEALYPHFGITPEKVGGAREGQGSPMPRPPSIAYYEIGESISGGAGTMAVRVAINGFGRIGRLVLRAAYEHGHTEIEVVAINDLGPVETNAHLLRYDSVHGRFPGEITTGDNWMDIGRGKITVTAERDPAKLPWGKARRRCRARMHRDLHQARSCGEAPRSRRRRVIISAPADGADMTVVMGVNHDELSAAHKVVSNASCTTNCLAPVAYVLHQGIGIERGYMTTIHSYTGDQSLQDTLHRDLRRARAANCR